MNTAILPLRKLPLPRKPDKLYIPSKDKGAKSVTIAVGFRCKDGVVLGADTELSITGWLKFPGSKIRMANSIEGRPVFAFAGDLQFCETIMPKLTRAIALASQEGTDLIAALEEEAQSIHLRFKGENYEAESELLLSLWLGKGDARTRKLFRIAQGLVTPVLEAACLGTGRSVAQSMTVELFRSNMGLYDAGRLAVLVLAEAKTYADGCGKKSQVLLLKNDGTYHDFDAAEGPWEESGTAEFEEEYFAFKRFLRPLLLEWAKVGVPPERIEKAGEEFVKSLVQRREITYTKKQAAMAEYNDAQLQRETEEAETDAQDEESQ